MKRVTIYSLWTKRDAAERTPAYIVEVPAGADSLRTLENAFALTNRDDRPHGNLFCSTTAGDVMVVDNQHYLVENVGYRALTFSEAGKVLALTSRDTSFGYEDLKKNNLL